MLAELFVYGASLGPTPAAFRPYLADAVGLWARGRRQRSAWAPHLERTRAMIAAGMPEGPPQRTVAVLGSGPLFDVPLEAIAARFSRVLLIDLAHLATTRRRLNPLTHVERMWRDLAPDDQDPLAFLADVADLDWVVSVNLVSQIGRAAPEGTARQVIDAHLAGLAALSAPATLVTDTSYRTIERGGQQLEAVDLLHGRPMPAPDAVWEWDVAPFGEESPTTRRIHSVGAWLRWSDGTKRFVR